MSQPLPTQGPPHIWLLGHLRSIRRDMLGFFRHCQQQYGDVALMRFGPRKVFLLSDPEMIEQILVSQNRCFKKHYAFEFLGPLLGKGLLTSEDDFWLRQRRLAQPAFARDRIEKYGQIMVQHACEMLAQWPAQGELDIYQQMTHLTLRIAAKTLMDVDIGDQLTKVGRAQDVAMEDFRRRFQSARPLPMWIPTPANLRLRRALRELDEVVYAMIQQRRTSGNDRGDLLSMLIAARDEEDGTGMTDRQLRDEITTLLLAGHETTAISLSWTWYLLAQHAEVERKLLEELQQVVGERPPRVEDLPRLVYTARIVKESMRLYPPAYAIGREATQTCTLGEYSVPRGTTIFMSQWVVHHDPRWYDDAETFRPERWTAEFEKQMPKYSYFPFGGGPRVCIGNTFATMEAILLVATVAQQYHMHLQSAPAAQPWAAVTLRPQGGIPVHVRRRSADSTGNAKANPAHRLAD